MATFRSKWLRAAALVTLLGSGSARADKAAGYMPGIDLVAPKGWLPGATFTARLTCQDAVSLAASMASGYAATRDGDQVKVHVTGYAPLPGTPEDANRKPSFLVDFDDPLFATLRAAIVGKYGEHPSPAQLAAFTDGYITNKDSSRGEDHASTVAKRKEGDCTEHAVLLAALVRLFGGASRLVNGVAFIIVEQKTYAFGHQWVEVEVDGKWQPFDGTRPSERPDGHWLPVSIVDDESMRRGKSAAHLMRVQPQQITIDQ